LSKPGEHLHTANVLGQPVRFFCSPLAEQIVPWHAVDDLHRALGMPYDMRVRTQAIMCREWATKLRTVCIDGQLVLIAGHGIAQGTIEGMASPTSGLVPNAHSQAFSEYDRAVGEAAAKMDMKDGPTSANAGSRGMRAMATGGSDYVH